jgi:hypothetical protein
VGAYLCLRAGISGQKLVESRADVVQSARVALAMMGADLRGACPLGPEFEFLGMRRTLGEVEADNLDFATYNHSPRSAGEFDFCRISYYLDENRETGRFTLLRRRNPDPAAEPLEGGVREEIAEGLTGMRLEYYDGFQWYEDWGDQEGRQQEQYSWITRWNLYGMPEAVRITLFFDPNPQARETREDETEPPLIFQTVVRLNLAGATWPPRGAGGAPTEGEMMPGVPAPGGPR